METLDYYSKLLSEKLNVFVKLQNVKFARILDRESNRYLNVSFVSARGTLIGSIYATEQRQKVDVAFSTYVGTSLPSNFNTILTLPAKVNGSRYVCFHPSGQPDQELCKW